MRRRIDTRRQQREIRDQSGDMSMSYVIMPFSALTHALIIFVILVLFG
jgi:hypothetical protein